MNKIVLVAALATLALAGCAKKEGPAAEAPSDASVAAGRLRTGPARPLTRPPSRPGKPLQMPPTPPRRPLQTPSTRPRKPTADAVDATGKAVENAGEKMQDAARD